MCEDEKDWNEVIFSCRRTPFLEEPNLPELHRNNSSTEGEPRADSGSCLKLSGLLEYVSETPSVEKSSN